MGDMSIEKPVIRNSFVWNTKQTILKHNFQGFSLTP